MTANSTGQATNLGKQNMFGISVDALTMAEAVAQCKDAIDQGRHVSIGVINAAKVVAMQRSPDLQKAVSACSLVLADGQSVVWASRLLRSRLPERVAGIDLFIELLGEADRNRYRVYFLGATSEVLARMLKQINRHFPNLIIAGAHDGYFEPDQEAELVDAIRQSSADMLFIGISSPKKELFLSRWGDATHVRVAHGVGGSFDILAGITRRAPNWCQRCGLEWLYRTYQEPIRLGRRYLTTNASFIALVMGELIRLRATGRQQQKHYSS